MASFRKKGERETPGIPTASLPDVIFILLFFFMVVTVMRTDEVMVKNVLPQATEVTKLERKELVSYVYIGTPLKRFQEQVGSAPIIQLDDVFANKEDIQQFVENERQKRDSRLVPYMTFSLKSDKEVTMGIVSDVKQELRKAQALKVNYSTLQRSEVY